MLVNLTPHAVILLIEDSEGLLIGKLGYGQSAAERKFRPVAQLLSQGVARAKTATVVVGEIEVNNINFPITKTSFSEPENLPEPDGETTFIVSLITAQAAKVAKRPTDDLLVVGGTARDAEGHILGCVSLGRA